MNELTLANRAADWHRLKALVLDSVSSPITKRVYNFGLDEFITWYGQSAVCILATCGPTAPFVICAGLRTAHASSIGLPLNSLHLRAITLPLGIGVERRSFSYYLGFRFWIPEQR
jgi:hypothetical protein